VIGRAGIGVDNVDIPGRDRQGHHRDEHAVRQFDHDRRTRHRADVRAGARDPAADASTQAGKWEKNRFMGVEITPRRSA
jgi:D-3-phosphoglycerate dehydrogenase